VCTTKRSIAGSYAYAALQRLIARGFRVEDEAARIRDLPLFARVEAENHRGSQRQVEAVADSEMATVNRSK
jgi:hypothetical protein